MCCNNTCSLLALLFSFVVGVIIAVITYFVELTFLYIPVAIALAIALLGLVLITGLILFTNRNLRNCLNKFGTCFIISIVGIIISTVVYFATLGLTIPILTAIVIFFVVFFFALLLIYLTLLYTCLVRKINIETQTIENTKK